MDLIDHSTTKKAIRKKGKKRKIINKGKTISLYNNNK